MTWGWGQASRHGVRCTGQGAGSTVTLEQAGQGTEDSCRFFGLAAGSGLPLQSLVGGGEETRPRALVRHCSFFSVTLLPAKASFLLWALQALSSALPASLREERGGRIR